MKLFTVGPTDMFDETLDISSKQLPYFRTNEFSKITLQSVKKLKKLLHAKEETKVIYFTASGSGAMESLVSNAFNCEDKLLVINGGTFGKRFTKLCEIHNIPFESIELKYGEILTPEHFEKYDLKAFSGLLVNIDETSTGQLYDIDMLSKICKENNIYLIVDAISSFLADELDMGKFNISCTIISSQKALALSPGLSMLAIDNDFYEKKIKNKKITNLYLDINEHVKNMERGQTPNTPAVGVILELAERLNNIKSADDEILRVKSNAIYFRKLAIQNGFEIPSFPLSNALTPIICHKGNAKEIFNYLKDRYGIYVNPTGGELENKILRISHLGNLKPKDYDDLIKKMKEIM